ncbi:ABC-type transport auxiliary lipoprotein family protein [Massilia sp. TWP1-3-3]|uniref:ABC-type transport auxiliary lipoprotein family protein n=1 Tax=Massilia sp. TWP1-3-3 TaxID=2804573 RepID=UPI003CEBC60E
MKTTLTRMKRATLLAAVLAAAAGAALLSGCSTSSGAPKNTMFDFGPAALPTTPLAAPAAGSAPIGAVVVTDVTGSAAFDNERMYYRLNYADALQSRAYTNSRWGATPLQLITQRLKTRIAQTGAKVLTPTDASNGVAILRSEIDDFTHSFDSASQSYGQLVLRASLFNQHKLVDQKTFSRKIPAASADAAGGARALAAATDAVAADINAWLATLPLPKQ